MAMESKGLWETESASLGKLAVRPEDKVGGGENGLRRIVGICGAADEGFSSYHDSKKLKKSS